jgi:hypothetical protein
MPGRMLYFIRVKELAPMKQAIVSVFIVLAIVGEGRARQGDGRPADQTENAYIDTLRADLKADKTDLVTEAMQFSDKDAAAFWPVYKRYEAEVVKLNDERVGVIKTYSDTWMTMADDDARSLVKKALDLESRRTDLRKKYFAEFSKVLPGLTVAKVFQVEHRLDVLVDLRIASELPALLIRSSGGEGGTSQPKPR